MSESYRICLSDYTPILPELAEIIGADYVAGAFEDAEEQFMASAQADANWHLVGLHGQLLVTFEKYEGYYFAVFNASGSQFFEGKELLWKTYLAQGGNPGIQEHE